MASPADQKLLELLEKWLTSLELHAKYAALDDERYWQIQPWKEHERPSAWIIDLATQKTIALKARVEERIARGDAQFCESLELMLFLANLVGAEHIERFIPMAEAHNERASTLPKTTPPAAASSKADDDAATGTREMPVMLLGERSAPPLADSNERVARVERRAAAASQSAANSAGRARGAPARGDLPRGGLPPPTAHEAQTPGAPPLNAHEQVISDAVRLVQWGRKWFELPELIARMAGRPPLTEVRRILKENKLAIDAKSAKP
jgi:hypothetical protein